MATEWHTSTARRIVPAREAVAAVHNCRPVEKPSVVKSSAAKSFSIAIGAIGAIGVVERYWSLACGSTSWIGRSQWASISSQRRFSSRL